VDHTNGYALLLVFHYCAKADGGHCMQASVASTEIIGELKEMPQRVRAHFMNVLLDWTVTALLKSNKIFSHVPVTGKPSAAKSVSNAQSEAAFLC
jgi:hypothetical protein